MSTDASTALGASGSNKRHADSSDDLAKMLLDELELDLDLDAELEKMVAPDPVAPPVSGDHVVKYHEMMRRALVDWGDEIIDTLCAKFSDNAKVKAHVEDVRKELVDPLRISL